MKFRGRLIKIRPFINRGADFGVITHLEETKKWQKKVQAYVKLQVAAGMANPSPPVGPALGQQGVNIMNSVKHLTLVLRA